MRCHICKSNDVRKLFHKKGKDQKIYQIIQCKKCKVVQVYPQPHETESLYGEEYFFQRTDRGYNHYPSKEMYDKLVRVWWLNLLDLGFFKEEKRIFQNFATPRLLEIGSASGHFLYYMKNRNWSVKGIEISKPMVELASSIYHLDVIHKDFLLWEPDLDEKYHCIVLWATIEHFRDPLLAFRKIYSLLESSGIMIFSTCRWGLIAKFSRDRWRFMNVPEHLFFFHEKTLIPLLRSIGFQFMSKITYGSGLTAKNDSIWSYRVKKRIFDYLAKKLYQGDMLAMMLKKP
ncbi:MAG: class I SAM-dependent methyltransferase [Leptospiraceae bacterium]|nr:class I SAM-dependent methyltransferase [Leptospiraceae bacterium]MDW7976828.1 class I SAM-dependent methyltransferase [Leptospiraceae bacterium]